MALYNLARVRTSTTGTGTVTLGGAVAGFLSFADAGAQNGDVVAYAIRDGVHSEIGYGTYAASGSTLTRNVRKSTNSDAAISLSGNAEVVITPSAETLGVTIHVGEFGAVGDGLTDDIDAIQAAIDHVFDLGGGEVRFDAAEYSISEAAVIKTGTRLIGKGSANTILKLAVNANTAVLKTLDFDALLGGATIAGPSDWAVVGMTLDGNGANQNGAGAEINGLNIYGYRFLVEDVIIRDCKRHGWRSDWAQFGEQPMEATMRRLKIDTCGRHGFRFGGPHDSYGEDIIVVDAGQETDDTYDGFLFDSFGGGCKWVNLHAWHRSTVTNRMASAMRVETGANNFALCNFEGGEQCLILRGDQTTVQNSFAYANFSTDPMVVVNGSHHRIDMIIDSHDTNIASCLQLGEAGVGNECYNNHFDVTAITTHTNAVVLTNESGRNTGTIKTIGATNAYSGSWTSDSSVLIQKPDGTLEDRGVHTHNGVRTFASVVLTTADINGGTIDGAVIGGSAPAAIAGTTITASGLVTASVAGNAGRFMNTADTGSAQALRIEGDRATPTDFDNLYASWYLSNDDDEQVEYCRLLVQASDVSEGTEDGRFIFYTILNGTLAERLLLDSVSVWPATNDAISLGVASNQFSDLFLAAGGEVRVDNVKVLTTQQSAIANLAWTYSANDPNTVANSVVTFADGTALAAATAYEAFDEIEAKINAILAALRTHGLIAT